MVIRSAYLSRELNVTHRDVTPSGPHYRLSVQFRADTHNIVVPGYRPGMFSDTSIPMEEVARIAANELAREIQSQILEHLKQESIKVQGQHIKPNLEVFR